MKKGDKCIIIDDVSIYNSHRFELGTEVTIIKKDWSEIILGINQEYYVMDNNFKKRWVFKNDLLKK